MSSVGPLVDDDEASAEIRAIYSDIRASRGVGLILNFWRALANDPPTLRRMWDSFNSIMAPGALDPLTKELVFLAVSATNGCAYCTAAHGTEAKAQGMSSDKNADGHCSVPRSERACFVKMSSATHAGDAVVGDLLYNLVNLSSRVRFYALVRGSLI